MQFIKKYFKLVAISAMVISFLLPKISFAYVGGAFVTTWKTNNSGITESNQIEINPQSSDVYNYNIDWGDGKSDMGITNGSPIIHTYDVADTYTVSITGTFPGIVFPNSLTSSYQHDSLKLLSVDQWGSIEWKSMSRAFKRAENLVINATDTPDISDVTSMEEAFYGAKYFDNNLSSWNTSNVTNMSGLFAGAINFDNGGQPLTWNTSKVTDMSNMFADISSLQNGPTSFNQDISGWNVSSVTNMYGMFNGAESFNQDIGGWNVSNVTSMCNMFQRAKSFNKNIGSWNVPNVTDMGSMFSGFNDRVSFNNGGQPLAWNTSKVTDMSKMFQSAISFNQNIGKWDVSKVTNMSGMFSGAASFNQDLGDWNVANVTNMDSMFSGYNNTTSFNNGGRPLTWNTSMVTDMSGMFQNAVSFNQNIGGWNVDNVTDMTGMFSNATSFNQNIGGWNVSNVTSMLSMFYKALAFDQDISSWNVSNVTDMRYMFAGTGMSISNYDNLLDDWLKLALKPDVVFDAGNSYYYSSSTQRQSIIDSFSWTISDSGEALPYPKLTYYGNFRESKLNNGTLEGSRKITFNNYTKTRYNNSFINKGGNLNLGAHYSISPNIQGLTPSMKVSSDGNTATLTFTGRAKKHTGNFSVNNLTITFNDSAFTAQTEKEINITNKSNNTGKIIFKTNTIANPGPVLYATDDSYYKEDGDDGSNLYILNSSNGNIIKKVGEVGHSITGMDFNPITGVLYGNTSFDDTDGDQPLSLFTIDKETAEATLLGVMEDGSSTPIGFEDIAFDSEGTLYGISINKGSIFDTYLYKIDTVCPDSICPITLVSTSRIGNYKGNGIAFDRDDVLYVLDEENEGLFKVNQEDGDILDKMPYTNATEDADGFSMLSTKFDSNNNLFGIRFYYDSEENEFADLIKVNTNTGAVTSMGGSKDHMIYMMGMAFDVTGTTVYHGQTIADQEGVATLSGETKQVMVTSTEDPIRIEVEDDVTDPKIILTSLISSETNELPQMEIITSTASVYIPAGEINISDLSWDGLLDAPTVATAEIPVSNSTFSKAIEVGSPDVRIRFGNAVKMVMTGEAGKQLGYFDEDGEFAKITNTCGQNTQSWANANLGEEGECKIDVGSDLVIWTKHFTKFATYTNSSEDTPTPTTTSRSRVIGYRPLVARTDVAPVAQTDNPVNQGTVSTTYNFGTGLIKQGQRNNFVKELQKFLNINLKLKLSEDGIFGPMTKKAVVLFQKNNSLTPDGVVGPMTKAKMK